MTTKKQKYIDAWNEHIKNLSILAMCENYNESKRIQEIQQELYGLVLSIAETKKTFNV